MISFPTKGARNRVFRRTGLLLGFGMVDSGGIRFDDQSGMHFRHSWVREWDLEPTKTKDNLRGLARAFLFLSYDASHSSSNDAMAINR